MKYQLAKLYRGSCFFGYGIAVGGFLLDGQISTTVETSPSDVPKVIAKFNLSKEQSENQPRIDLDNPIASNEFQFVIHPNKPLTASQIKDLSNVVSDFLARHQLQEGGVWKS